LEQIADLRKKAQVIVALSGTHLVQSDASSGPVNKHISEEQSVTLTCPSCGNSQNFLVKTLQMHVVHLEDSRVEVSEESRPAVFEVLCDECETAMKFEEFEDALRKEVLLTLGAR
jgi:RNase P subunit RPR2